MRGLSILFFFMLVLVSSPAKATGEIFCASEDESVKIDLSIGRLQVLLVLNATVIIGDKAWSSIEDASGAEPLAVGQVYGDSERVLIDFMDGNYEEIIAKLRLFSLTEGDVRQEAGVFSFKGQGAWAVNCLDEG